jgi:hypothetical protein
MAEKLALLAQEADDIPALSALLQDATLRRPDLVWDARRRRVVLMLGRYCWEAATPARMRSALRIESVLRLQRQAWPDDPETVLALLSLTHEEGWLRLDFSGGAALRAEVEAVDVVLDDVSGPFPTARVPAH